MFIDSHAHIEGDEFDADRDAVIQRARDTGVDIIVDIGNGELACDSHAAAIGLAELYPFIYTTVGVHPHEAQLYDQEVEARLIDLSNHPKVIAWGEIGLDYHYDNSPREVQRRVFRRQLQLARERKLPVTVHTREAEADTLALLTDEWSRSGLGGVIHCFTGSRWLAEQAIELGLYISFSGVVTFKKAEDIRSTVKHVPLNRMLIETDSPFLAPAPHRGKRNEPAYVVETAHALAGLRGLALEEVGRITSENFKRLFRIEVSTETTD
jgi:TatD DNase family protein